MLDNFKKVYIIDKGLSDINPVDFGSFRNALSHGMAQVNSAYYIYYIERGEFHVNINGTLKKYTKNQICIIKPETKYFWRTVAENPCDFVWIGITGTLCKKFEELINDDTRYKGNVFTDMCECIKFNSKEEFLAGNMHILLSELMERYAPPINNYVELAKEYMRNQFFDPTTNIQSIANAMNINRSYLSRIFKKSEGITAHEYLMQIRLSEAAELLKRGHSVTEVSYMTGFCNQFYFSSRFKKNYGLTPSKYIYSDKI